MTTENQTTLTSISTTTQATANIHKMSSRLEDKKVIAVKPLSLRPNRSLKKNVSLKPLGLKSR